MAKEGISGAEAIKITTKRFAEIVDGDISAEVLSTTFEEMIKKEKNWLQFTQISW